MPDPTQHNENRSEASRPRDIIVFDFDGTITTADTFALFLRYWAGPLGWTRRIIQLLPTFAAYKLGRIDRHAVKHAVVRRFFAGASTAEVALKAESFARDVIPNLIRPAALARFLEVRDTHPESLYICSASITPYLRNWARSHGVQANRVMAVELKAVSGRLTGELNGYNVWGENKIRRIYDEFSPHSVRIVEAYGDTRGDREMLHAAKASFFQPFRV